MKKTYKTLRHYDTMILKTYKIFLVFWCLSVLVSFSGCVKPPLPAESTEEAHKKLKEICLQDLDITPIVVSKTSTLHIYIPTSYDLTTMKPAEKTNTATNKGSQKRQINFVEATAVDQSININYDISEINVYQKDLSYASAYSDEFSKLHNGLLTAVNRALGDLEKDPPPPNFVVLLIVNTENGVGIKNVFYYLDLKNYLAQLLPQDEYLLRYMTEMIGNTKLINNNTGKGLEFKDITWPEFIAKQITYRINFKYGRSDFPPTDSDANEIMTIINDTVNAYNFDDFETIELNDLASGETFLFNKEQLKTFKRN